jgi:hypothetical protein
MLELEAKGENPQISEGIDSEFRDIINWAIFGALISRGYGISILDVLKEIKSSQKRTSFG